MKLSRLLVWGTLCLFSGVSFGQEMGTSPKGEKATPKKTGGNLALCLDGLDNNVRINMGILPETWTIEAWIKGNDQNWNDEEVIIGAGEYSEPNSLDTKVLMLKKGCLSSTKAKLTMDKPLDDKWHHVAVSCDGTSTRLFLDGQEVAKSDIPVKTMPGVIGAHLAKSTFGGLIDEVRVWEKALSADTLKSWMGKPVTPAHPDFKGLKGYYPFDDMTNEMSVNLVGRGHQAYHVLNGRHDFKGTAPVAYTVANDNPAFKMPSGKQTLFNAVVVPSEWDADQGKRDEQVLKVRVVTQGGKESPLSLNELQLDLSQTTDLKDIEKVHVYYTGGCPRSELREELFGSGTAPKKKMIFRPSNKKEAQTLASGINYFLVTFDVSPTAKMGNTLKATVPSVKLGAASVVPTADTACLDKLVISNSDNNPNLLKCLQWNIWHGGVHLVEGGRDRVVDLIRETQADVVTMQEGYGCQEKIAKDLNLHLQTASPTTNLALFSRLPMEQIKTKRYFNSNPALLSLKNGRKILVNDVWTRYAYRPEYTTVHHNEGLDTNVWVEEDKILSMEDMTNILKEDVTPYLESPDMPVLVGGDFNSCSDLDWTAEAARFHNGYGPVPFPTSQYMREQGFTDSFREMHPDAAARPEGTFAVVLGHCQYSRIDFIYYRGKGIKTVASKCIRSHPEIDYVWPSDHAAVLSVFEVAPDPKTVSAP